jgi:DNA-binding MarR family transcriptional regulator
MTIQKEGPLLTKQRMRQLINYRLFGQSTTINPLTRKRESTGKFTAKECGILKAIGEGTPANGKKWQMFDISTGRCATTQEELAVRTNSSVRTVRRTIKKAEDRRYVKVHRGEGAHGQDEYTVTLEGVESLPTSDRVRRRLSVSDRRDRRQYFKDRYEETKANRVLVKAAAAGKLRRCCDGNNI